MRKAIGPWAIAASLVVLGAGCKFQSAATPATQVVVDIEAEPRVRAKVDELTVYVASAKHRDNLDERVKAFEQVKPAQADPEGTVWPLRMVFTPREDDPRRVFELSATAVDAEGKQVAQARVITGYVVHEIRYVKLVLEDDCIGIKCGELETCRVGGCAPAFIDPDDLPLLPSPDEVATDAGDAGVDASDAGEDSGDDAGRDAGDSGPPPIDPCLRDNGGCDQRVLCQTIDGVPTCGQCPNGFVDVNGNGSRCEDVDECDQPGKGGCDAAHGVCTNTPGGHDCACEAGYHGDGRECTVNVPCNQSAAVCDPLATCQAIQGQKVCQCKLGYEGDGGRGQCLDVDECTRNTDGCPAHSGCNNSEGAFSCVCDSGWEKPSNGGNVCNDINECTRGTDNCDAMPDACQNIDGSFRCQCPAGYMGSGVGDSCLDINECAGSNDCNANANCTNIPVGSFTCTCKPGYRAAGATPGHGLGGCVEIDECVENTDECNANSVCTNTPAGSYTCTCNTGYTPSGNPSGRGTTGCAEADECTANTDDCDVNATCTNMPAGSFTCTCNPGYMPTGATPGHTGGCVDINECAGTNDCNTNATCTNTEGSYTCTCNPTGFTPSGNPPGRGAGGCVDINECTGVNDCNTNATCTNTPAGSYTCTCNPTGFTPSGNPPGRGPTGCTDIDECATDDCDINADCMQGTPGTFSCTCKAGYTAGPTQGHGTGGCVDACATTPCAHGTCAPAAGGRTCNCATACGFSGVDCEVPIARSSFGLTTGTAQTIPAQTLYAVRVTGVVAGSKLVAIHMSGASGSGQVRLGVYENAGSAPSALVAAVGPSAIMANYSVDCTPLTAGGTYWIAVESDQLLTVNGTAGGTAHVARGGANLLNPLANPFGTPEPVLPDADIALSIETIP